MNSEYLYEFMVLAHTLSFSQAAKMLFIAQPTLSRHIKELENELGEVLFVRDSHTVKLTQKGHIFAREAAHLNSELSKLTNSFDQAGHCSGRVIRIACASSSFSATLREFLEDFGTQNTQYVLEFALLQDQVLDQLAQGFDLLFSPFEQHAPAGMLRQNCTLYEKACLSYNMRLSADSEIASFPTGCLWNTLLVPYVDELFCSYAYHKQLVAHMTGNKMHFLPVPNVETALLYVQWGRSLALVPHHMSTREYPDVLFSDINDKNYSFSTVLYAKENLDYDFVNHFVSSLNAYTESAKSKSNEMKHMLSGAN